VNITELLYAT